MSSGNAIEMFLISQFSKAKEIICFKIYQGEVIFDIFMKSLKIYEIYIKKLFLVLRFY
jgi:hypothetical protein